MTITQLRVPGQALACVAQARRAVGEGLAVPAGALSAHELGEAIAELSALVSQVAAWRLALAAEADVRRVAEETADTDTTVKVSFDKIPDVAGSYAIVGSRQFTTPGGTTANGYRAKVRLDATGGAQLTLSRVVGGTETAVRTAVTVPGVKLTAGSQLQIRMQTQGTGTTNLRARAWMAGTPEPTTWLVTATDTTAALQTTGGQYLSTYLTSSSTNIPVVGRWDDLVVSSF